MSSHVDNSIILHSQGVEMTEVSIKRWTDKEIVNGWMDKNVQCIQIFTYIKRYIYKMESYSAMRKKEILPFVTT